jgi:ATP dependent DNA ligase domain
MPRSLDDWRRSEATALPGWIKPQLTRLVDQAPDGPDWLHEIKFDGYRMHARLDRGAVRLLTRTGLDWTHKYPAVAAAVALLPARQAYLDGELCGVRPDGTTSFSLIQNASDTCGRRSNRFGSATPRPATTIWPSAPSFRPCLILPITSTPGIAPTGRRTTRSGTTPSSTTRRSDRRRS